jgi:methionyl-tRNA synthetase
MTTCYLTTPIYYANDLPHIGHAYTTIAADAIARRHRLYQRDVFLVTGTDEHGINIERIAAARGLSPQQHVDAIAAAFQALWRCLDIEYDGFVRTSSPQHARAALELWRRLRASGDVYRGVYHGWYCPRCEAYSGEQTCPVHGLPCERVEEENWFFRLSSYQAQLEHLIRDTEFVQPASRRNEVLGVLRQGLTDFSVTRRQVYWGIPVPDEPGEVLYVWVDALASYLSGVGFPNDERYWPADTHLIGKEILRFHCLYWPALLLSAGLPLPRRVYAHGWLTRDGKKISKTTGNVIDPVALTRRFGSDAVRSFFLGAIPFGQDGDYTHQAFVAHYTAELANGFGNLVQRTTSLACRHRPGAEAGAVTQAEEQLRAHADALGPRLDAAWERLALHDVSSALSAFLDEANRYLEATAPWLLARDGHQARLATVLGHAVEAARLAAWHATPLIPRAAAEAHRRLTGSQPLPGQDAFAPTSQLDAVVVGPALFPRVVASG